MPGRRHARELAMQALYSIEVGHTEAGEAIAAVVEGVDNTETRQFVNELVFGAQTHRATIDAEIAPLLRDWSLDRLPIVDLTILRIAFFELRFCPTTPPVVVIDEAIEMAKRFSAEESGAFINGVLARVIAP